MVEGKRALDNHDSVASLVAGLSGVQGRGDDVVVRLGALPSRMVFLEEQLARVGEALPSSPCARMRSASDLAAGLGDPNVCQPCRQIT